MNLSKSAIRHFIFTLGPEFETIQNNFHLGNLPAKWATQDWPSILILCHDYYNSVKPQGLTKHDSSSHPTIDQEAHQKKIKHLSKSHTTDDCHVKEECERNLGNKKPTVPQVVTTNIGQMHHITEDVFADAAEDNVTIVESSDLGNDTNEDSLLYFARLSKHYLCLVTFLQVMFRYNIIL